MDVVGYVQRLWGVHMDIVRNRGSKGMDGCPLTVSFLPLVYRPDGVSFRGLLLLL
jgi:hypothetical protein